MTPEQKRGAERVVLQQPIEAKLGDARVRLIELSLIGCRVEHYDRIPIGAQLSLTFNAEGEDVSVKAKVARTEIRSFGDKPKLESGLQFAPALGDAPETVQRLLEKLVGSTVPDPEATMDFATVSAPDPEPAPAPEPNPDFDDTQPIRRAVRPREGPVPALPKSSVPATEFSLDPAPFLTFDDDDEEEETAPYVECVLENGRWKRRHVADPRQPREGFTMLVPQDAVEIDAYCRTYEVADPETRRLIRISFELAIAKAKLA